MKDSIILGLLQNTAILLSFAMLYENIWLKNEDSKSFKNKIIAGLILGGIGIALMFTPWTLVPGIVFDTRSVMLSVSGLFFGFLPTFVSVIVLVFVRIYMGGDGIWMGLAVIASSAAIGLLWRNYRPFWRIKNFTIELLAMGLTVHIVMSGCTLLLPTEKIMDTFRTIALPLILIYTPATMLLGLLMLKQSRNWHIRMAEIKLQESERRLNQILESGNVVSLMLNKEGNITYCNNYFLFISGYSFDEIHGKSWFELFIPKESNRVVYKIFTDSIQNNNVLKNHENQIIAKNGERLYISWYNISLQSETDAVIGIASIGVNITESKIYEQELLNTKEKIERQNIEYKRLNNELMLAKMQAEESDQLKSAFLNNISHEIRTPFNGILGFLSIIRDEHITIEDKNKYIDIINKSAYRFINTINDIVEMSKIHTGQMKMNISETNISQLTDGVFKRFLPEIESKGLKFSYYNLLPGSKLSIKTDAVKINTILSNFIDNAVKFTKSGSIEFSVKLKATEMKSEIEFSVKDTGIGIPTKKFQSIFESFMQADVSITRPFEGSGLGLSIAKAHAMSLNGKIRVESIEGEGSCFYFSLPYNAYMLSETDSEKTINEEIPENLLKKLKILIVDDDEMSRIYMALIVRKFAKEILEAETALQAIEACRLNPDIDLVLMDIKMPDMNGYEATKQIKSLNKDVIIIAQTAFAMAGDREKAIKAGCNDYVAKPVAIDSMEILYKKYFNN